MHLDREKPLRYQDRCLGLNVTYADGMMKKEGKDGKTDFLNKPLKIKGLLLPAGVEPASNP